MRNRDHTEPISSATSQTDEIGKFELYLRYELNRSKLTADAYMADLRQFISFISPSDRQTAGTPLPDRNNSSDLHMTDVSTATIRKWLGSLASGGNSPRTIRRKTQSLRTFFRYLQKNGLINVNPAADIVLAKTDKPLPQFVRESEIEKIVARPEKEETFTEHRDRLIVNLLYTTGMRRAEILGLRDSDIDLTSMQLRVTGKRDKQRIIPFGKETAAEIESYISKRDADSEEKEPGGHLFTHRGRPMSAKKLGGIVASKLADASVAKKSPHTLRHTFATTMLNHGAELNSVKEILGHASVATTQIYTHLSFQQIKENYTKAHPREKKRNPESK